MPKTIDMTVAFAGPDFAETAFLVQTAAGNIFGENVRLQCPIACSFGDIN